MTINTRAYGEMDIDERQLIRFPHGILGFESHREFALLDAKQRPFYWLQSLTDVQVAFVLISPDIFRDDFSLSLGQGELERIAVLEQDNGELVLKEDGTTSAELLVLAIVTVSTNKSNMTANLQGPIIINAQNHLGMQGIQSDDRWKTKHFILEEMSAREEMQNRKEQPQEELHIRQAH